MNIIKNKKGGEGDTPEWIPSFIFFAVVLTVFFSFYLIYYSFTTDIRDVESAVFANRLIYAKAGISLSDINTNRVFVGVIDPESISAKHMEEGINYGKENKYVAANVSLFDIYGDTVVSSAYNEAWFNVWSKLGTSSGKGAAKENIYKKYVLYSEDGDLKRGVLVIDVVVPNS